MTRFLRFLRRRRNSPAETSFDDTSSMGSLDEAALMRRIFRRNYNRDALLYRDRRLDGARDINSFGNISTPFSFQHIRRPQIRKITTREDELLVRHWKHYRAQYYSPQRHEAIYRITDAFNASTDTRPFSPKQVKTRLARNEYKYRKTVVKMAERGITPRSTDRSPARDQVLSAFSRFYLVHDAIGSCVAESIQSTMEYSRAWEMYIVNTEPIVNNVVLDDHAVSDLGSEHAMSTVTYTEDSDSSSDVDHPVVLQVEPTVTNTTPSLTASRLLLSGSTDNDTEEIALSSTPAVTGSTPAQPGTAVVETDDLSRSTTHAVTTSRAVLSSNAIAEPEESAQSRAPSSITARVAPSGTTAVMQDESALSATLNELERPTPEHIVQNAQQNAIEGVPNDEIDVADLNARLNGLYFLARTYERTGDADSHLRILVKIEELLG